MYQLANVTPKDLEKLEQRHQAKIVALTGQAFEPVKGLEQVKKLSKGFTESHPKAQEADALLAKLLAREGILGSEPRIAEIGLSEKQRIHIGAEARKRKLKLVMLKLKMNVA